VASCTILSALPAHANVTLLDKDEWKVGIYGFAETDMIYDTTRSLSESFGNAPVDRPSTYAGDNGRTQFSIRNSRIGFTVNAPKANDWVTKGVMEFDFMGANGGSGTTPEATLFNNPVLRARHFFGEADKDGWQILAGQYWTLFGWQPTYILATLSDSPVTGTLYQRTAQVTAIKSFSLTDTHKFAVGVSVVRPVQRDSQIPGLDAGVRWSWSGRKSGLVSMTSGEPRPAPLSVGVSGRLNQFSFNGTSDTVSTTHMMGSALAVDTLIPILGSAEDNTGNTLTLTGEFTTGQGYSEAFPNFTGNLPAWSSAAAAGGSAGSYANPNTNLNLDAGQVGFDPSSGITLVHLTTFNLQLQYHLPTEWMTFVTAGYGQIYSDNIDPLTSGVAGNGKSFGPIYDRDETYFLNVGHNFTKQVRLAAEFDLVRTTYADGIVGHDDRGQISAFFYF
jgi:hypothetical protein